MAPVAVNRTADPVSNNASDMALDEDVLLQEQLANRRAEGDSERAVVLLVYN